MSNFFKRNTNIYISTATAGSANATNTVQLNVKDFSYNQRSNIQEVNRQTLDSSSERTIDPHISVVAPAEFSLTTYVLPLVDTNVTSPEEYLWTSLAGATNTITSNSTSSTIDFANGNVGELQNLTIWFDQPAQSEGIYRLDNAVVDSANISFDINGLAEIVWQGRALAVTEDNTPPSATDRTSALNYLKNKLSTLSVTVNAVSYDLALIGGSLNIDNSVIFYGRSKLGETTTPVGHYTGSRRVSGDLNLYLKSGTNSSADLLNTIITNVSSTAYESTYLANITINLGGTTAPYLQLNVPQALLEIPDKRFDEVISMGVSFVAKEEAGNYVTVVYNMP